MGTYIVKDKGERVNIISIEPAQVERYAALTGYTLEPFVADVDPATPDAPAADEMEAALNELGVVTRE